MPNAHRLTAITAGLLLTAACSSAEPRAEPASPTTSGAEADRAPPPPPLEPVNEPVAAPPPSAPATITIVAAVHGEPKPATVSLVAESGETVASGPSGQPLTVPSGEYTALVTIEDAAVLADKPTQRVPITLQPGDAGEHRVELPWASVQLNVRVNGRPEPKATVRLMRQGALVTTMESGGAFVTLSPGRYHAEVVTRDATITVEQILIPEGATRTVPVDVKM